VTKYISPDHIVFVPCRRKGWKKRTIALLLADLIWWRRLFRKVIRHSSFLLARKARES
jgi:hypothetical protein